jgi:hypothetical protein
MTSTTIRYAHLSAPNMCPAFCLAAIPCPRITSSPRMTSPHRLASRRRASPHLTSPRLALPGSYAMRHYGLELHGAILNERTGEVDMVGRHPQQAELLKEDRYLVKCNPNPPKPVAAPSIDVTPSTHSIKDAGLAE